jgi:hypothetical protein
MVSEQPLCQRGLARDQNGTARNSTDELSNEVASRSSWSRFPVAISPCGDISARASVFLDSKRNLQTYLIRIIEVNLKEILRKDGDG